MNILPLELILHITRTISFRHAIHLLSTCKTFYELPYQCSQFVPLHHIVNHSHARYFIHVKCERIMKNMTHLNNIQILNLNNWCFTRSIHLPDKLVCLRCEQVSFCARQKWPSTLISFKAFFSTIIHFPSTLERLHLRLCHYSHVEPLPINLVSLKINDNIESYLHAWPTTLQILNLQSSHNHPPFTITPTLPHTLKVLRIHAPNFDQHIHLPFNLQYLKLFRHQYTLINLASTLTKLQLHEYNQPLCTLPQSLQVLSLMTFNHRLIHAWPTTLTKLQLHAYNQPIDFDWPPYLSELTLLAYNQSFQYAFPKSLKTLILHDYNMPFTHRFPSLTYLNLHAYEHALPFNLPLSLKRLNLYQYNRFQNLPSRLEQLTLHHYDQIIQDFPSRLKYLDLKNYHHVIDQFPLRLQTLRLGQYNHAIKVWPSKLKYLSMTSFNSTLPEYWPQTLRYIRLMS